MTTTHHKTRLFNTTDNGEDDLLTKQWKSKAEAALKPLYKEAIAANVNLKDIEGCVSEISWHLALDGIIDDMPCETPDYLDTFSEKDVELYNSIPDTGVSFAFLEHEHFKNKSSEFYIRCLKLLYDEKLFHHKGFGIFDKKLIQ